MKFHGESKGNTPKSQHEPTVVQSSDGVWRVKGKD